MKDRTDEKLRALEAWLQRLYKDAESEMRGKWDKYLSRQQERAETLLSRVREAETDEECKEAEKAYQNFLKSKCFGDNRFRQIVDELAKGFSSANAHALDIINGRRSEFFAEGYNLSADRINNIAIRENVGIRFDLIDEGTVDWLAKNRERNLMPPPEKIKIPEDERWSAKLITSQVSQGIVQGESIPKIAKRLENVTDGEAKACIRRARTMATNCENAGRVESMKRAEDMGVKTKKRWLCTHDQRTRDTHLELDGETIDNDAVFWNGCRWPGDHLGPPGEVWNCRCTLITVVDGFSSNLPAGKEDAVHVTIDGEELTENSTQQSDETKEYFPVFSEDGDIIEEHEYTITHEKNYGFPDGNEGGIFERRDADIYTLDDGTRIICPSDMDEEKQTLSPETLIDRYYHLPEDFRNQIQNTIHILDYQNPMDRYWEKQYGMTGFRSYATGGKSMDFYAWEDHDQEYLIRTLAHEGGHYIDLWRDNPTKTSSSEEWQSAKHKDLLHFGRKAPSEYAGVADAEDFAESIALYITRKDYMERYFPNRAEIIERILKS